jgi:hypothetical protein
LEVAMMPDPSFTTFESKVSADLRKDAGAYRAPSDAAERVHQALERRRRARHNRSVAVVLAAVVVTIAAIALPIALRGGTRARPAGTKPGVSRPVGTQLAELTAPGIPGLDTFGSSVAVSSTTAIVGAPFGAKGAGDAYVFAKTAPGWRASGKLTGSDTVAPDLFGSAVALSGATAVVGAPGYASAAGRVYVFSDTGGSWRQTAELRGSDATMGDTFGFSVAISGGTIVVGAQNHAKGAGSAYVFTDSGGWKQTAELKGSDTTTGDTFGTSVAIEGTTAVVGAPGHASVAGRVYVFTATAGHWKQSDELVGSDTVASDEFGTAVAISGTTVEVGAPGHADGTGRAYMFMSSAGLWKQASELEDPDASTGDLFGDSVAISGSSAVVGAEGNSKDTGQAFVSMKVGNLWKTATELRGADSAAGDGFGTAVAISGSAAIVGAPAHAKGAGRAYVFEA